jgi:hypothetical protein
LGYERQPSAQLAILQMTAIVSGLPVFSERPDLDNRKPRIIPILRYRRSF